MSVPISKNVLKHDEKCIKISKEMPIWGIFKNYVFRIGSTVLNFISSYRVMSFTSHKLYVHSPKISRTSSPV